MTDRSLRFDRSANHVPCTAYGGDHLYYSCYNPVTLTWSQEIVDDAPMVGSYAALDFNNYNIPFISYYDALNASLKLAYKAGIGWAKVTERISARCATAAIRVGLERARSSDAEQVRKQAQTYWDQLLEFFPYLHCVAWLPVREGRVNIHRSISTPTTWCTSAITTSCALQIRLLTANTTAVEGEFVVESCRRPDYGPRSWWTTVPPASLHGRKIRLSEVCHKMGSFQDPGSTMGNV
jgi:hypothetical protein